MCVYVCVCMYVCVCVCMYVCVCVCVSARACILRKWWNNDKININFDYKPPIGTKVM